jgi:hypothetical protein
LCTFPFQPDLYEANIPTRHEVHAIRSWNSRDRKKDLLAPSQEIGELDKAVVELSHPLNVFIQKKDSFKRRVVKKENGQTSFLPWGGNKSHGQTTGRGSVFIIPRTRSSLPPPDENRLDFETVNRIKNISSEEENSERRKSHSYFRSGIIFWLPSLFTQVLTCP